MSPAPRYEKGVTELKFFLVVHAFLFVFFECFFVEFVDFAADRAFHDSAAVVVALFVAFFFSFFSVCVADGVGVVFALVDLHVFVESFGVVVWRRNGFAAFFVPFELCVDVFGV